MDSLIELDSSFLWKSYAFTHTKFAPSCAQKSRSIDSQSYICFSHMIASDVLTQSWPVRSQSVENSLLLLLLLVGRATFKFHRIGKLFHHYHENKLPEYICALASMAQRSACSGENGRSSSQSQIGEKKNQKKYFLRNYLLFSTVNFTIILFTQIPLCVVVQAVRLESHHAVAKS